MNNIIIVNALLLLGFLCFSFAPRTAEASSFDEFKARMKIRMQIEKDFKNCLFKEKKKLSICLKERKAARQEMEVSFKHNWQRFVERAKEIRDKIREHSEITFTQDGDGKYYINVAVDAPKLNLGAFSYTIPELSSSIQVAPVENGSQIVLKIYEEDLYRYTDYEVLKLPGRETFPLFIDGTIHDGLSGVEKEINGKKVQVYADGHYQVFGSYVEVPKVGDLFDSVNNWKNGVKILQLFPDISGLPLPLYGKGQKIGKINILGYDESHTHAGILIRLDYEALKNILAEAK